MSNPPALTIYLSLKLLNSESKKTKQFYFEISINKH